MDEPGDLAAYPANFQVGIKNYMAALELVLEEEAEALASVGLQAPPIVKPCTFSHWTDKERPDVLKGVSVSPPEFALPPHVNYVVRKLPDSPYHYPELYLYSTYSITAPDPEPVARAQEVFKAQGLPAVVALGAGRWFNRDPYALYKFIMRTTGTYSTGAPEALVTPSRQRAREHIRYRSNCISNGDQRPSGWPVPALKLIPGFSAREVAQIEARLRFLEHVSEDFDIYKPEQRLFNGDELVFKHPLPDELPDRIVIDARLPILELPPETVTLAILPSEEIRPALSEDFINSLRGITYPLIFEVAGTEEGLACLKLTCASEDEDMISRQLRIFFPSFPAEPAPAPPPTGALYAATARPRFSYRKTRAIGEFALDPYAQLISLFAKHERERPRLQVIFIPCEDEAVMPYIEWLEAKGDENRYQKKPLHGRAQQLTKKLPAWGIGLRVISGSRHAVEDICRTFLPQFETPNQTFTFTKAEPAVDGTLPTPEWALLAPSELAALVHFPTKDTFGQFETASGKSGLPPELFTTGEVLLGETVSRGRTQPVTLPDSVRDRHVYLVGKTRSGKSTMLFNIARQDIARGEGVAVIDPHGDLVEDLLHHVPRERASDTIYLDAADKGHPIPLDIMNAQSDEEVGLLADDLMVTFRRLSDSWGERMETILRYAFHTLLRTPGSTFVDIQHLLQHPSFRERAIQAANFPLLTDFWQHQYPQFAKDAAQPILNRMSKFVLSPALYAVLSRSESALNFSEVLQQKKVLLVNLASGRIGEDNAKLRGSLIVSQLQLAVMRRAALPKAERTPYYLFVDEFQNFTTSAFEKILSEAGKYKLSLTLAHQYISQLSEGLRNAILGNVGTLVMFPLGPQDAHVLRSELGEFEAADLTNLSAQAHEVLCRPATQSQDTFKFTTLAPPPASKSCAELIIKHTREHYGAKAPAQPAHLPMPPPAQTEDAAAPAQAAPTETQAGPEITEGTVYAVPPANIPPEQAAPKPKRLTPRTARPVSAPAPPAAEVEKEPDLPGPPVIPEQGQPGRGGRQHKYLQQLVKRIAEARGYRVTVEQVVLGGAGFVDVALERGARKIACEISVTTPAEYEVNNIQKCLAAGFEPVIVISADRRVLARIEETAKAQLEGEAAADVLFMQPEQFLSYLAESEAEAAGTEATFRGHRVRVQYRAVDTAEEEARKRAISEVIMGALKRMKPPGEGTP
ncbi:MAG: type IV secretion system DNA-binding domain-containing protein [Acidobacteriota bacterium]|nr:type IV secretion system DNA-binding domain-containing protein [Acidobacteriota bacterium]